jgi:CBS domain-containing protein
VYSETLRELLLDKAAMPLLLVGDLMRADLPVLSPDETLEEVLDKFTASKARSLPVLGADGGVLGLMTRGKLTAYYHEAMAGE